jgi:hypothetical protein
MYLNFYVYAYVRESDDSPYYIGKGSKDRAYRGRHSVSIPKDKTKIIIIEANLSEIGALAIERRMIRWYGRKDLGTGILRNRTDGGDGVSGKVFTDDQRKQRSCRALGNQSAKNTVYTNEMREARSKRALGNQNAKGGKSRTGQVPSEQQRLLNSIKHAGTHWWNNGIQSKKSKECPGNDYSPGRLKSHNRSVTITESNSATFISDSF